MSALGGTVDMAQPGFNSSPFFSEDGLLALLRESACSAIPIAIEILPRSRLSKKVRPAAYVLLRF